MSNRLIKERDTSFEVPRQMRRKWMMRGLSPQPVVGLTTSVTPLYEIILTD